MATVNVQAGRERTIGFRGALGEAFQQVMEGLSHIQEAFLQQEQRTEERLREMEIMMRESSAQQERRLQEERRTMEAKLAREEEARMIATSALEDKLRRMETRVEALERRSLTSGGQQRDLTSGVEERLAELESRIQQLDASTKRALESVVPRVDALLNQLETVLPPGASRHPNSTLASTSTSGAASAPSQRPVLPPLHRSSVATPPLTPERLEELGERLFEAACEGTEADVRRLLDEGADVNFTNVRYTPLMCAAFESHANVVSLLIEMGADVSAKNSNKSTALHFASANNKSGRCASLLLRAGALVDSADDFDQTPLHVATWAGNEAAARALLAAGASKSVRNNRGKTPSEYATTDNLRRLLRP